MHRAPRSLLLPLLLAAACATPEAATPASHHWLLVVASTPAGFRVVQRTVADGPVPAPRRPRTEAVRFSVKDRQGRILYTGTRTDPRGVRAELPGQNEGVPSAVIPSPGPDAFLLRIPDVPGAVSLTLEPSGPGVEFPSVSIPLEQADRAP